MIDRSLWKNAKNFLNTMQKNSPEKFLIVTETSS